MNKKWAYFLAVFFLIVLRVLVLNTNYDEWLYSLHYENAAAFIRSLRSSPPFLEFVGSWALPFFVACVLLFWMTEEEEANFSMQFVLLPIVYIPFSVLGAILFSAEFKLEYLYVHPLVILPFGYVYIGFWIILIWLLEKLRFVH